MADPDHLKRLQQGVAAWNALRERYPDVVPDLSEAALGGDLSEANLSRADLGRADLSGADLSGADLTEANLNEATLGGADLCEADLSRANLRGASLIGASLDMAKLGGANLYGADLSGADLGSAYLIGANFNKANLSGANLVLANLTEANLNEAKLNEAKLSRADLVRASLVGANLCEARLSGADLSYATLVNVDITNANLTGCHIYGVSAWGLKLSDKTEQRNLIITKSGEPEITVDDIEVAQFVYLLLHNAKIRNVIDTIGKKGVLLLGRFTEGRIAVLERLRAELRKRGYVPIVFNFDKPETKDFSETVRLLAGLAHFVIADVTNPKSAPLELQATVPEIMVPFLPIIEEGEKPFATLEDLWIKHREWVFEPLYYSSRDALIEALDKEIIEPAEARFDELIVRKAERMKGRHV
jgi:uncharacterized protein YjbI with pentapeptide repeats